MEIVENEERVGLENSSVITVMLLEHQPNNDQVNLMCLTDYPSVFSDIKK